MFEGWEGEQREVWSVGRYGGEAVGVVGVDKNGVARGGVEECEVARVGVVVVKVEEL